MCKLFTILSSNGKINLDFAFIWYGRNLEVQKEPLKSTAASSFFRVHRAIPMVQIRFGYTYIEVPVQRKAS